MVRKHIKMEPRRWYFHCDSLGLLVWQDVPSKHEGSGLGSRNYEQWLDEMRRDVHARRSHPSIVLWITYNEGWGQKTDDGTVEHTIATLRQVDGSRLINDASGGRGISFWVGGDHANVTDVHHYSRPEFDGDKTRNLRGSGAGYFSMYNRNKKSISLDLKSDEGLEIAKKIISAIPYAFKYDAD